MSIIQPQAFISKFGLFGGDLFAKANFCKEIDARMYVKPGLAYQTRTFKHKNKTILADKMVFNGSLKFAFAKSVWIKMNY